MTLNFPMGDAAGRVSAERVEHQGPN